MLKATDRSGKKLVDRLVSIPKACLYVVVEARLYSCYRDLFDCERMLAAKLFVCAEYLLLRNTCDALFSIAAPVCLCEFLCDKTLAANDFCVTDVPLLLNDFAA